MRSLQLSLFILSAALIHCSDKTTQDDPSKSTTAVASATDSSKSAESAMARKRTTSPKIAVANLNAQIRGLQKRISTKSPSPKAVSKLVDTLLTRAQFFGSFSDFDMSFQALESGLKASPDSPDLLLTQSRLLSSVHRFEEASQLASRLRETKVNASTLDDLTESIALARGEDPGPIAAARLMKVAKYPNYRNYTKLAAALSSQEKFDDADAAYQSALDHYRDVSPFPMAWVAFQRGVMWGESAGNLEKARVFYTEALSYLPDYVVANVHLAEIEFAAEDTRPDALERLERIASMAEDPEPRSRLAEYLAAGKPARSKALVKRVNDEYGQWLDKYPLAFADHAAEFYLGAGSNSKKALELAKLNLENRKTKRAYELGIDAAKATQNLPLACAWIDEGQLPGDESMCPASAN